MNTIFDLLGGCSEKKKGDGVHKILYVIITQKQFDILNMNYLYKLPYFIPKAITFLQ